MILSLKQRLRLYLALITTVVCCIVKMTVLLIIVLLFSCLEWIALLLGVKVFFKEFVKSISLWHAKDKIQTQETLLHIYKQVSQTRNLFKKLCAYCVKGLELKSQYSGWVRLLCSALTRHFTSPLCALCIVQTPHHRFLSVTHEVTYTV